MLGGGQHQACGKEKEECRRLPGVQKEKEEAEPVFLVPRLFVVLKTGGRGGEGGKLRQSGSVVLVWGHFEREGPRRS